MWSSHAGYWQGAQPTNSTTSGLRMRTSPSTAYARRRGALVFAAAAAAAGIALVLVCDWPGYLTSDPIDQLTQARERFYSDWHPPIMSWWMGQLDAVFGSSGGMLLFHNLLFWTG